MLRLLFKISSRLVSATLLVGVTIGFIYLATTRSLPFLPEDEQVYSYVDHTSKEDSSDEQHQSDASDEVSQPPENSVEDSFDISAYLETFEKVSPANLNLPVSQDKYDPASQKLILYGDLSPLGELTNKRIEIRMGYIFVGDRIFTSNLTDVTELLSGYTFAGERDLYGNPLFKRGTNYYYLDSSLVIQPSNFAYYTDRRAFDFDVPVYLGVQDSVVKRTYNKDRQEGQRYGYYEADGDKSYAYYCVETFAFDGDRGVGIKKINGVDTLEIYSNRFLTHGGNIIATGYYPPVNRKLNSIGYFYFDDGFTRVRIKNPNGSFKEGLINKKGELLSLLDDFALVSYSDSILLVSNGINYGYMTNRLTWVTNPVFTTAEPFLEGLAVVGKGGKYGVIDTKGNYVIKPVFDRIIRCSGGLLAAHSDTEGWQIFAKVYS